MARAAAYISGVVISRVALVSPYALSVHGGVQEQVLAMSRELSRRQIEVLVVAPDEDDLATYDTPATIVRIGRRWSIPANGSRAPLTIGVAASRRARDVIQSFSPDVVHLHEPFAPTLGWSTLTSHAVANVGTFHRHGEGPALAYARPLLRRLARGLDIAASVSDAARATWLSSSALDSVVLFNGFETDRFVAFERERSDGVAILCVGRLERRKGVDVAISAVRRHNEVTSRPWRLLIAGDGPERNRLRALAGRDESITFLGPLDDEEKRQWYRRASVVVAPATRGESFGLILLEAMASEVVVVASDIDGYRLAGREHATYFPPGNADELGRAIESALARETPERLSAARAHAEQWSMRCLVDHYLEFYEQAQRRYEQRR